MFPKRIVRNSALRLALGYVILFGASSLIFLGFIYWSTASYMMRQADETIEAEITGLAERYRLTGLAGLTSSIRERLGRRPAGSSIYLLADGRFTPIVGNLSRWPLVEADAQGWMTFELTAMAGEPAHTARAKPFRLPGGFHLLVGRDIHELELLRSRVLGVVSWGLALTVALALIGGVLVSRSRLRRIGTINEAISEVMAGDLSRRIPREASGDDIEELVAKVNDMLDELENLVEGVRRVSDSIAHDLRTPLARLKTRIERLRQQPSEDAEKAAEEADQLLSTFGALLRIARIESGERRAAFADVDLTAVVDDVADLYRPAIEDSGRKLTVHNAPQILIHGDRDMLFQAVVNLVDNAIKYADHGIELSLGVSTHDIVLTVADDGPGIPPEERARVLERFYRLESSRTTPGVGLGLSLVAAVVGLHHGELRFEDNAPGLRVVLSLPEAMSPT